MDEDNTSSTGPNAHVVGHKSWVAYLGLMLLAALLFGVILPLTFHFANEIAAAIVMAVSVAIVGYRFLALRSVVLYYDDIGVWVFSGVLPWKKGVSGVKWRDMDEATFEQGFWSWISRSYTIRIGHRFTKASEIRLTDIGGGKNAVATLNSQQQTMIRAGQVD
jgi:hypothetical protein